MDALFLERIVHELRDCLSGALVKKIFQPGEHDLVLRLWSGRANYSLLISTVPHQARVHLVTEVYPNPPAPPRFCQLLRSRLNRLTCIEQLPGERTLILSFAGDGANYRLICELFGTQGNVILVDEAGIVVDALRRVSGAVQRTVCPGEPYVALPRAEKIALEHLSADALSRQELKSWLVKDVTPMTGWLADDIVAGIAQGQYFTKVLTAVNTLRKSTDFQPRISVHEGKARLQAWPVLYLPTEETESFSSPSVAAEKFYRRFGREAGSDRQQLTQVVTRALRKLDKRRKQIESQLVSARDFQRMRELGELLLATMGRLRRGLEEIELDDWFADPPGKVMVSLDPLLTPQENVDRYFKRYRKAKRGIEHMDRRLKETAAEREWLLGVQQAIDEARRATDLHAVKVELEEARLLKLPSFGVKKRLPPPRAATRTTTTPGGLTIHWGMNNHSNDHVTKRLTDADDLWFHVNRQPGCHLVIKCPDGSDAVAGEDIAFAASLAAGYSRARHDSKVEVMVARGRAVSKPKGWRPGLVRVTEFKSVMVAPLRLQEDR